jgi:aldehyde:ferredoxin oxidoreductase
LGRAFDYEVIAEGLSLLTGISFDKNRLEYAADRALTLERMNNIRERLTRKDDTLPRRLLTEPLPDGPAQGRRLTAADLDAMLSDYYDIQGWDRDSGVPTRERLTELGLAETVGDAIR